MIKPDIILWDWDNTLVNSRAAAEKALQRLGAETHVSVSDDDVTEVIGGHLVDFWYRHYGPDPIPTVERFITYYREYARNVDLFPEAKPLLTWLHNQGIPQSVVSNKDQDIVTAEAHRFGIYTLFRKVVGTINHGDAKPSRTYADFVLGKQWPKHILMIGDGESDMQFARTIGAFGILIRPQKRMADIVCDKRVDTLSDVFTYLREQLNP